VTAHDRIIDNPPDALAEGDEVHIAQADANPKSDSGSPAANGAEREGG
jgi:hypothetical protein